VRTLSRLDGDIFLFDETTGEVLLDGRAAALKPLVPPSILEFK
jgi:hypothetical protein